MTVMRILLVGPVPPHPGGGALSRGQLAAGFASAGHDVRVIAPITREALGQGDLFARRHPAVRVIRYVLSHFDPVPFCPPDEAFLREESRLVEPLVHREIAECRPDLVVVGRETFARYVPQITLAAGVPSVLFVRGSPTGHILAGQYPAADAECLLREFRKVDHIIAVARFLQEGLLRLGFSRVSHIHNAIDTAAFAPRQADPAVREQLRIPADATMVLIPANLHERKRPEDVVSAATLAARQDPRLAFVFAGVGVLRARVERLCEERGLSSRVRFPGWIEYDRMPALMNASDLVVLASESEGLARVYLEAMACGRLLIASDIPSAREIVRDGVNGVLFPLGDAGRLATAILAGAAEPERRQRLGSRARNDVAHLTVERAIPRYLETFQRVVGA